MPEQQQPDTVKLSDPNIVPITDLDDFVRALVYWHANKVQTLKHMQDIPEGTEVSIDDGDKIVLEGAALRGFQAGLLCALSEMGELPFTFDLEDDGPAPGTPATKLN